MLKISQSHHHYHHVVYFHILNYCDWLLFFAQTDLDTHVNNGRCAAVQVFVQVVQHLPQLLQGLFVGLQEHCLKVHGQPVSGVNTASQKQGSQPLTEPFWMLQAKRYTHLRTDSTKTLSALMWIHAIKASLKFTFSHRTSGPCASQRQNKGFHIRQGRTLAFANGTSYVRLRGLKMEKGCLSKKYQSNWIKHNWMRWYRSVVLSFKYTFANTKVEMTKLSRWWWMTIIDGMYSS